MGGGGLPPAAPASAAHSAVDHKAFGFELVRIEFLREANSEVLPPLPLRMVEAKSNRPIALWREGMAGTAGTAGPGFSPASPRKAFYGSRQLEFSSFDISPRRDISPPRAVPAGVYHGVG